VDDEVEVEEVLLIMVVQVLEWLHLVLEVEEVEELELEVEEVEVLISQTMVVQALC